MIECLEYFESRVSVTVFRRAELYGHYKIIVRKEVWWEGVVMFRCLGWRRDFVGKDCLFITKLFISCGFFMDVKAFHSV